jgi:hypothetical protein
MSMTNEPTQVLVLRDVEGNYYVLTEDQIRATRATPEQQAALREVIGDQDVAGFADHGGFSPVGTINIVVAPQITNQVGFNIAAGTFAPVQQSLGQGANSFLGAQQRGG